MKRKVPLLAASYQYWQSFGDIQKPHSYSLAFDKESPYRWLNMTIDVKQAVHAAREQASLLFEGEEVQHLMLEEVELDNSKNVWLITLGYDSPSKVTKRSGPQLFQTIEEETKRQYKVFSIDGDTGEFVSMKIRDV
jgi:hypothetical protein